ncbi:hypothetical protein AUQ48_09110 [Kocuria flava]|uniref:Uncharacterized protein n=1 Tax=Kocuria flava TaxID=446860 RepID=A0A2N4T2C3_9MICC|nr:hypothetical protein AUQ48_09110 [Kocuria flava]
MTLLRRGELRLLASESAACLRDRHAFARPLADEVCFELGDHAQHVEQQLAHRVGWIMNRTSNGKSCPAILDLGSDVGGIPHRACETIQLRDHEGVAFP